MLTNRDAWTLYSHYLEAWRAIANDRRAAIIGDVMADDLRYATPRHETGGRDTAIADAAAFQQKFPGGHFDIGDVSAHHDVALLTWVLTQADGTVFARGHDQIRVANGKIVELTTFAPPVTQP